MKYDHTWALHSLHSPNFAPTSFRDTHPSLTLFFTNGGFKHTRPSLPSLISHSLSYFQFTINTFKLTLHPIPFHSFLPILVWEQEGRSPSIQSRPKPKYFIDMRLMCSVFLRPNISNTLFLLLISNSYLH